MKIFKWAVLFGLVLLATPILCMANGAYVFNQLAQRGAVSDKVCESYGGETLELTERNMQEISNTPGAADGVMYYGSGTFVVYVTANDPYGRDYAYRLCKFKR